MERKEKYIKIDKQTLQLMFDVLEDSEISAVLKSTMNYIDTGEIAEFENKPANSIFLRMKNYYDQEHNKWLRKSSSFAKEPSTGYIYIMKDNSIDNVYKVGVSINPEIREKTLLAQKASVILLDVLGPFNNVYSVEKDIHNILKEKGYQLRGEWFTIQYDTLKEIINSQ